MASYGANQLKNGLKLLIDSEPYSVVECEFVKPGKGQAFTRIKVKNLLSGRVTERTYKSSESIDGADVTETDMQYLYSDNTGWNFMDPQTYEQVIAESAAMGGTERWIKEEDECTLTLWNGRPILVTAPNFVELEVTETDPGVRGDTSSGGTKPATVETGAVVKVPLFVQIGDRLRIDTRSGEYVSRAKG